MVDFSDKFKGKELWKSINLILFFAVYALIFIVPMMFPEFTGVMFVILAFIGLIYYGVQQTIFRKMDQKNAGRRVIHGWVDHEEGVGEEFEIVVDEILPFKRLSKEDQMKVDEFLEFNIKKENEQKNFFNGKIKQKVLLNKQKKEDLK